MDTDDADVGVFPAEGAPAVEGEGEGAIEDGTPRGGSVPITPMRELSDCRGRRMGGRGGERGHEEGDGEMGRKMAAPRACCC